MQPTPNFIANPPAPTAATAPEVAAERQAFVRAAFAKLGPGERQFYGHARPTGKVDKKGKPLVKFKPLLNPVEPLNAQGLHINAFGFVASATRVLAENGNIVSAHLIMLDDVGDMAGKSRVSFKRIADLPKPAKPHAIVSTRVDAAAGTVNCQAFFFIEPCPAGEAADLMGAATDKGWGDPDAVGRSRWCRPPGSLKFDGNGHIARLIAAGLDKPRIAVDVLAAALGVPGFRQPRRKEPTADGTPSVGDNDNLPSADVVRDALSYIQNHEGVTRRHWIILGHALKACCGAPPALSDDEGLALFDAWTKGHSSYDADKVASAWKSFKSTKSSFGTVALAAKQHGWPGCGSRERSGTELLTLTLATRAINGAFDEVNYLGRQVALAGTQAQLAALRQTKPELARDVVWKVIAHARAGGVTSVEDLVGIGTSAGLDQAATSRWVNTKLLQGETS